MIKKYFITLLSVIILAHSAATAQHIEIVSEGKPTSIRGLSVVNDQVAWVSGSKGYVGTTINGGKTWHWQQVKGFEKADFRDVEAFSANEAIIMTSGTPALILKTVDGGRSWQLKYRNDDAAYFFDAMDFDGIKRGFIIGDPIKGSFLAMETTDGGETWSALKNPPAAMPDEAAFAASGTCLRTDRGSIFIVSGGSQARLITLPAGKTSWNYYNLPFMHGKASQGGFSLAITNNGGLIVGGDYANDKKIDSVAAFSSADKFETIMIKPVGTAGFRSCVELINGAVFLSTGTPGSSITTDGGKTWSQIDSTSFNVCGKAKHGKLVLLAGNGGKIGILSR